jgi:preprotein translocase subunit SecE
MVSKKNNSSKAKKTDTSSTSKVSLAKKLKQNRQQALEEKAKPRTVADNLRPESRVAKVVNRLTNKASEVGEIEVSTPTPTTGVLGRRLDPFLPIKWFFRYLRDSYRELKKVTWPDRKSAWKLTGTVFIFSVIMALILFGLDSLFSKLFELAFLKD